MLADEDALTHAIIALASEYGRYGYRRVTALLQADSWQVGKDRVQRDLSVARGSRSRRSNDRASRLWLNDGSCVRLRPLHRNHVWSFDFVQAQTHDGRSLHILTLIDENSRACLALKVARRINSLGVIEPWPTRCACTASQSTSVATTSYVARKHGWSGNRSLSANMRPRRVCRQRRSRRLLPIWKNSRP